MASDKAARLVWYEYKTKPLLPLEEGEYRLVDCFGVLQIMGQQAGDPR